MKENIEHVNSLNTISKLEELGFEGSDGCIEVSLKEYGLAWLKHDNKILFVYGIDHDGSEYTKFDRCTFESDLDVKKEYDWADFAAVLSFVGLTDSEWSMLPLPYKVSDMLSYYGVENIFGSAYWEGFEIS